MHTDERVALKEEFLIFLNDMGWNIYLKEKKFTEKWINFSIRLIHFLILVSVLGLSFSAMKSYIPKYWWWVALSLAIFWLIVERLSLTKVDNFFMKKINKRFLNNLNQNEKFIEYITLFENKDIAPPGFTERMKESILTKNNINQLELLKQLIYYLQFIRSIEQIEKNIPLQKVNKLAQFIED